MKGLVIDHPLKINTFTTAITPYLSGCYMNFSKAEKVIDHINSLGSLFVVIWNAFMSCSMLNKHSIEG